MKILNKSTASLLSSLVMCLGLASCAAPLMFGGVLGTAMVASDRRTTGIQVEDEGIEQRGASAMTENFGSKEHINITSYNRQVLITGEVSSDAVRRQAEQLISRVQNVRAVVNELVIGPLVIDVLGHEVRRDGVRVSLTPLEFNLLQTLAEAPKQVFTREDLLKKVWGYHYDADTRLVNVHVQRLRSKIEDDPDNPKIVVTERGVGYKAGQF